MKPNNSLTVITKINDKQILTTVSSSSNLCQWTSRNPSLETASPNTHDEVDNKRESRIAEVQSVYLSQFRQRSTQTKGSKICKREQYNQKQVVQALLFFDPIQNMVNHYKNVQGLPKFMQDFLNLLPSGHRETLYLRPELIKLTEDKQFLILPNPSVSDHEILLNAPEKAKEDPNGFGLVAWFMHPSLLTQSDFQNRPEKLNEIVKSNESLRYGLFGNKDNLQKIKRIDSFSNLKQRDAGEKTISTLEQESKIKYLTTVFDCTPDDLSALKNLRDTVNEHLREIYKINENDHVLLYFHTLYPDDTVTLHLHIRINQIHHGLEFDKSILLDDLIDMLERKENVLESFLKRNVIHRELTAKTFLDQFGFNSKVIENPYLVDENNKMVALQMKR